jgi:hypothetical protein
MLADVTHDEVRALLPGFAAATLTLVDADRVSAHLVSGCTDCIVEVLDRLEVIHRRVELSLPVPSADAPTPPPTPSPTPSANVPTPPPTPPPTPSGHVWTLPPRTRGQRAQRAVALACAVAAAGFGAWSASKFPRQETSVTEPSAHLAASASRPGPDRDSFRASRPEDDAAPPGAEGEASALSGRPDNVGRRPEPAPAPPAARASGEGRPGPVIAYSPEALTMRVGKAPLSAVLEEIGHQAGAVIRGEPGVQEVGGSFEDVPLDEALDRLLRKRNYTLRYGPEGDLRAIDLLGEPLTLTAAQTTRADMSTPDERTTHLGHRHRVLQSLRGTLEEKQVLVTVAGTGADRSGSREFGAELGDQPGQGATTESQSNQDNSQPPDEIDRRLRRRFLDLLSQMDESTLAQYFATADGQQAQVFLEYFAANHAGEGSRQKASDILSRIPARANQTP